MFVDTLPDGELLLPVCIEAHEIHKMLSALEMYRVMVNGGENYPAFEAVLDAIDNAPNPQDSPCLDVGTGVCWAVDTTNSAIRFYPNDPFISIDLQERSPIGQWERWEDSLNRPPGWIQYLIDQADNLSFFNKNIGYFPNDCFVVAPDETANDVTQFFDSLNALKNLDFPYVEIEVRGTGELELHLLKVPFGGSAIIVWDIEFDVWGYLWDLVNGGSNPPSNIIQTELEREIATLPPESNEENVIEIDFTEDIDHVVRVYFVPRFDYTALDFLGNGGGIREVSACDGLTLISPDGDTITKNNFKIGEFTRKGFIMGTREDIRWGVHHGIYDVMRDAIAGHGDGVTSNIIDDIILGKDGDVTIDKESGLPAPEFSTTLSEIKNGGAYNQAVQFAKLFTDTDSQMTADFSNNLIIKSLQYVMHAPELIAFNITNYITTASPVIIDVAKLAESIYCTGSFSNGLFEYASNPANHIESDFGYILDMAQDLENSALSEWYADGKSSPLTLYTGYACYRLPSQSYHMDASNYYDSTINWYTGSLTNRRYRVEVDVIEPFLDAEGRTYDGVYWTTNGNNPSSFYSMRLEKVGSGTVSMLSTPAWLNGAGKYVLEFNSPSAIEGTTFQGFLPLDVAISGEMDITIYDLGAL